MNSTLQLTPLSLDYLNQTRKWTYFLSIIGFIFCGLLALAGLFFGSIMTSLDHFTSEFTGGSSMAALGSGFMTVFYLVVAFLIFIIYRYLFRFSVHLKTALASNENIALEDSFKNLKSYWKITGIITIIALVFYAIAFLFALIGIFAAGTMASYY